MKCIYFFKFVVLMAIIPHLSIVGQNIKDLQLLEHKNFRTDFGKQLKVSAESGDVEITPWHSNEVMVNIYGNENAKEKMKFVFDSDNNSVTIKSERKNKWRFFTNIKLRYEIKVPAKFNMNISTAGGNIKVGGVNGEIYLNTSGGDIWADRVTGNLRANTSGGDIKIFSYDASIDGNTSGGDIILEYFGENKNIKLRTSGGDIKIKLPSDFNARVELATSGGDVNCDFKLNKVEKFNRTKIIGELNNGGQKLIAKTSGGDIEVKSR